EPTPRPAWWSWWLPVRTVDRPVEDAGAGRRASDVNDAERERGARREPPQAARARRERSVPGRAKEGAERQRGGHAPRRTTWATSTSTGRGSRGANRRDGVLRASAHIVV